MKENQKNRGIIVFSSIIICFLTVFGLMNVKSLTEPVVRLQDDTSEFEEFVEEVQENYTSDFSLKNQFINLNGLFARLTGRRVHNEVNRLDNGMLVGDYARVDVNPNIQNVAAFSEYVGSLGIPSVFSGYDITFDFEYTVALATTVLGDMVTVQFIIIFLRRCGVSVSGVNAW